MPTLGEAIDKVPAGVTAAYRSEGKTVTVISAAGGETIGDVLVRAVGTQSIGVVSSIDNDGRAVAVANDRLQVRIHGMFFMPKAAEVYSDGDRVEWVVAQTNVAANATGAHEVVGGYDAADAYALVRINAFPGPRT